MKHVAKVITTRKTLFEFEADDDAGYADLLVAAHCAWDEFNMRVVASHCDETIELALVSKPNTETP